MKHKRVNNLEIYKFDENIKLSSFSTMYIYNFKKNYDGIIESHKQYELILVNKGSIVTVEDDKEYVIESGQAFLHKPFSVHQDKNNGCSSQVSIISFLTSSPDIKLLFDQIINLSKEEVCLITSVFNYVSKYLVPTSQFWFSNNRNLIQKDMPYGFKQIIKNRLELFFISIIGAKKDLPLHRNEIYSPLSNKIIELLKRDVHLKFSLEKIAEELYYSKNYLCRHFKANTGYTINNYFYNLKIDKAKQLLTETDYNLYQISEALNFETLQYFSLCFKKYVGVSPSIFRKNANREGYYYGS